MKGALLFAINNETTDYVQLAAWSADNIRRHLDIPVAVIVDRPLANHNFDQVIVICKSGNNTRYFPDYQTQVTWHNNSRVDAYDLSPWDATLLLDVDYVVATDTLKVLFDTNQDFLAYRWAYDVTGQNDFSGLNYFGNYKMPQWWATVMYFRRSRQAELIFDTMKMIRNNWDHYRHIYSNSKATYRNDHALTIALGVVNGHTLDHPGIPGSLATLMPDNKISCLKQDQYRIDYITTQQHPRWITVQQDIHVMAKRELEALIASSI
jgi:hypothetical protein